MCHTFRQGGVEEGSCENANGSDFVKSVSRLENLRYRSIDIAVPNYKTRPWYCQITSVGKILNLGAGRS
jgi:hypothetical protein